MATVFRTLSLWLVVSCLSIASATERLAVLELSGDAAPTTVMQQLSDKLRAGALEAIRAGGSELEIMTRESMAAILGDMGLDVACIEGQCEVETARNLRAAYVVSGSMIKLEGEYILTVKLHDYLQHPKLPRGRRISINIVKSILLQKSSFKQKSCFYNK